MYSIGTLGPHGTCSEAAARKFLSSQGIPKNRQIVTLYPSFEQAFYAQKKHDVDLVIMPAAYQKFNEIVFRNLGQIFVEGLIHMPTPPFVLVSKPEFKLRSSQVPFIACHESPAPLLERFNFKFERLIAASNAIAVQMVRDDEADLCVTNEDALKVINSELPSKSKLCVLEWFGSVDMSWTVYKKKDFINHYSDSAV
jgi:hypothetical protein